ncbi:hypothetical protein EDM54_09420 [Brevibacillus borstelensis]|jgi:hypothetical protein|uniref:hypothetical protein n=1 Tax=Brevibacillus borstelensis TaxID=45462 RepID=UPI000F0814E7|nr:hypothetical protein [Brevibacillus borstelensis]MED1884114.1 hypothetical protein [Brevibacillus borstelensis]RNB63526.1 hypothetical protein EDM54_09420 [Brevibacillus borstelensis]
MPKVRESPGFFAGQGSESPDSFFDGKQDGGGSGPEKMQRQRKFFEKNVNPLKRKNRTAKPFLTEHSFGQKSGKMFFISLTPPRRVAIIRHNTLFSDNNEILKILIQTGYDKDGACHFFYREPRMMRTGQRMQSIARLRAALLKVAAAIAASR